MRCRTNLTVAAIVLIANVLQAFGQKVYLNRSWIDGLEKSESPFYVRQVGESDYTLDFAIVSGEATFEARVEKGHEVVAWSYGGYQSLDEAAKQKAYGHYTAIASNNNTTIKYTPTNKSWGDCLAVHQDWLKYAIAFDANGGTGNMTSLSDRVYNVPLTLPPCSFAKEGFSFDGWARKPDATFPEFTDGASVKGETFGLAYDNKSVRLYAVWRANDYEVTYDANGGAYPDGSTIKKTATTFGDTYQLPTAVPLRGGYTFENAWTNAAGTRVDATVQMRTAKDHTVYAVWKSVGLLRIDAWVAHDDAKAGGTVSGAGSFAYGEVRKLQANPNESSDFNGWTLGSETGDLVSTEKTLEVTITKPETYYAHFGLRTFTVTFKYKDANGNDAEGVQTVKYGESATPPETPAWPHHAFDRWDSDYQTITKTCTITALYTATWTVTFDANGGDADTLSMKSKEVTYGQKYGPLASVERDGEWEFAGWKSSDGEIVTKDSTVVINANHTLKAQWRTEPFWVTLDTTGGTVDQTSVRVTYDDVYPALPTPTWKGRNFLGWFTAAEGGTQVKENDRVQIRKGEKLYAQWETIDYTLAFDLNGAGGEIASRILHTGDRYDKDGELPTPSRTGYDFGGWYTDKTYQTFVRGYDTYDFETDQTLVAKWTAKTYVVNFSRNEGSGWMDPMSFTWDEEKQLRPNLFTRTDYKFLGWGLTAADAAPTYEDQQLVSNLTENASIQLFAVWKEKTYAVSYNANGGAGEMASQKIGTGASVELTKNAFTRTGYTFVGWAIGAAAAEDGTVSYLDGQKVKGLADDGGTVDLWAVWRANTYSIRYFPNGASGQPYDETPVLEYDVPRLLTACKFTREGCSFQGWMLDPQDGAVLPAEVLNLTAEDRAEVKLFAKWQPQAGGDPDLAAAADCAVTQTEGEDKRAALALETSSKKSSTVNEAGDATKGVSYIRLQSYEEPEPYLVTLTAKVRSAGTLSFKYRVKIAEENNPPNGSQFLFFGTKIEGIDTRSSTDGWQTWSVRSDEPENTFTWQFFVDGAYPGDGDYADIDDIRWVPDVWGETSTVGVTFRANDGSVAPADIVTNVTRDVGKAYGELPTLMRAEREFLGWATTATATTADVTEASVVPAKDVQLYAVWKTSANPEPTETDRPVIRADFSFVTDARFDYVIWTTESLESPIDWTEGEPMKGDGKAFTLPVREDADLDWSEAEIAEGRTVPQRFYKVEVRQRK